MKEDLSNLKVGDKVYSLLYGWDKIFKITEDRILVGTKAYGYDRKGCYIKFQNQTLFTYNPFEKSEFPKWMEVDHRKVWVIYKSELNTYLAFDDKMCDTGTARWYKGHEIREIPESTEMTIKEIEEKLGINNLKIMK